MGVGAQKLPPDVFYNDIFIHRIVSISAAGNSAPSAIAFRYLQRVALMMDPKWNNGHYYETGLPFDGTRLAR